MQVVELASQLLKGMLLGFSFAKSRPSRKEACTTSHDHTHDP
jgi:hypothetical protein